MFKSSSVIISFFFGFLFFFSVSVNQSYAEENFVFSKALYRGTSGEEVKKLQEFLGNFLNVYPEKLITGYFGSLTEAAVKRFQENQGIVNSGSPETTGFGRVGPKTRGKINDLSRAITTIPKAEPPLQNEPIPVTPTEGTTSTIIEETLDSLAGGPSRPLGKSWENVRVTNDSKESFYPVIAWSGTHYGIIWEDSRDLSEPQLYFALLDGNGKKIVEDTRITFNLNLVYSNAEIVWNGNGFALVYDGYPRTGGGSLGNVYFRKIDTSGNLIGSEVMLDATYQGYPSIFWDGRGYGVTWRKFDGGYFTNFSYLDSSGQVLTDKVKLWSGDGLTEELVWTGSDFGIVSSKRNGHYLMRVNASGSVVLEDTLVSNNTYFSSVAWGKNTYALIEYDPSFTFISIFDNNGKILVKNSRISSDSFTNPDVVWNGNNYGVVDHRNGTVRFVEIRRDGALNINESQISDTVNLGYSNWPRIVWSGSKYAIVWHDSRHRNNEIYFATGDTSIVSKDKNSNFASVLQSISEAIDGLEDLLK